MLWLVLSLLIWICWLKNQLLSKWSSQSCLLHTNVFLWVLWCELTVWNEDLLLLSDRWSYSVREFKKKSYLLHQKKVFSLLSNKDVGACWWDNLKLKVRSLFVCIWFFFNHKHFCRCFYPYSRGKHEVKCLEQWNDPWLSVNSLPTLYLLKDYKVQDYSGFNSSDTMHTTF